MKNHVLAEARKAKGLTQEQLAKMLGYKGKQAVCNWETGVSKPPLDVALKIADILEKDVKIIFFANEVHQTQTIFSLTVS